MTREEIFNKGVPIEPNCFETDREEQWYKVGLYGGATANQWHKVADGDLPEKDITEDNKLIVYGKKIGFLYDVLYSAEDKVFGYDNSSYFASDDFEELDVEYWMIIPELPKNGGEK